MQVDAIHRVARGVVHGLPAEHSGGRRIVLERGNALVYPAENGVSAFEPSTILHFFYLAAPLDG